LGVRPAPHGIPVPVFVTSTVTDLSKFNWSSGGADCVELLSKAKAAVEKAVAKAAAIKTDLLM
jgi:hypothetical protein